MLIKALCPHCHKGLRVKQELIGKKGKCPACLKVFVVNPPEATGGNVEELAAAALADASATDGPVDQKKPVEFTCLYCDERVEVSADLAGKQTPCPHCRRIVKVPLPAQTKPKDWRQAATSRPLGARQDEPAPVGSWGTATSRGVVSAESLLEADAIPVVRERMPLRRKIAFGSAAAVCLVLIALGVGRMRSVRTQTQETNALEKAMAYLPSEGHSSPLEPAALAEIYRAVGELHLREGRADDARRCFQQAREQAKKVPPSVERQCLLVDLAADQAGLGGDSGAVKDESRISWQDMRNREIAPTLRAINPGPKQKDVFSAEAQAEAVRRLSRRLADHEPDRQIPALISLLGRTDDAAELFGVAGLELALSGHTAEAERFAAPAAAPYEAQAAAKAKPGAARRPVAPSALALLLALRQDDRAARIIARPPKPAESIDEGVRLGYIKGWAYQGRLDDARALVKGSDSPVRQLEALVAIGWAALDKDAAAAGRDVEAATQLLQTSLQGRSVPPWLLAALVRLAQRAGRPDQTQRVLARISDPESERRARLEAVRSSAESSKTADADALANEAGSQSPNPLVLEALARQNARYGSATGVVAAVDAWPRETLRPFGYVGVALGVQDSRR